MLGLILVFLLGLWRMAVQDMPLAPTLWSMTSALVWPIAPLVFALTIAPYLAIVKANPEHRALRSNGPLRTIEARTLFWSDMRKGFRSDAAGYALLFGAAFLADTKFVLLSPFLFWYAWRRFTVAKAYLSPHFTKPFRKIVKRFFPKKCQKK